MNNSLAATGGRAGVYQRPWDLMPDLGNSTYVLDKDFGEGPRVLDEKTKSILFKKPKSWFKQFYFGSRRQA